MKALLLNNLEDPIARENFSRIDAQRVIDERNPFEKYEWRLVEQSFQAAAANVELYHGLPGVPSACILAWAEWKSGSVGTITLHYEKFTKEFINVTISGGTIAETTPVVLRLFVGTKRT